MKPLLTALLVGATIFSATISRAAPLPPIADYGDAPEGTPAYPWLGVIGAFPTCYIGGPSGYIAHAETPNPTVYFGPSVDYEPEGNGGACPGGGYNNDECAFPADADAGLLKPQAWTISGGVAVPCGSSTVAELGVICTTGAWGSNIDATLVNSLNTIVYLNVAVDWNQDGHWGPGPLCGGSPVPERIVVDVPIQPHYAGPVSGLPVPTFTVGPDSGFVWVRLTLTESPMGPFWDGSGVQPLYDVGETEDYLLHVAGSGGPPVDPTDEFGDAPEGALAYPDNGVVGRFPTCTTAGPAGSFVRHRSPSGRLAMGAAVVDVENDGNAGDCAFNAYDRDECSRLTNPDAGLRIADPLTIVGGVVTACPNGGGKPLGTSCALVTWGQDLDLLVHNQTADDAYLNALFDWNRNGAWGGNFPNCPIAAVIDERVLIDLVIPAGFSGLLSTLNLSPFHAGGAGPLWCRFTHTPTPVNDPAWDGSGTFADGETEDYLLTVADQSAVPTDGESGGAPSGSLRLAAPRPNPFQGVTRLHWTQPATASAEISIHDLQGRIVRRIVLGTLDAGSHDQTWDGADDAGRPLPAGIYLVRITAGGTARSQKVIRTR